MSTRFSAGCGTKGERMGYGEGGIISRRKEQYVKPPGGLVMASKWGDGAGWWTRWYMAGGKAGEDAGAVSAKPRRPSEKLAKGDTNGFRVPKECDKILQLLVVGDGRMQEGEW